MPPCMQGRVLLVLGEPNVLQECTAAGGSTVSLDVSIGKTIASWPVGTRLCSRKGIRERQSCLSLEDEYLPARDMQSLLR
eukprot:353445-Chlamydomonas_euryale.AAC.27